MSVAFASQKATSSHTLNECIVADHENKGRMKTGAGNKSGAIRLKATCSFTVTPLQHQTANCVCCVLHLYSCVLYVHLSPQSEKRLNGCLCMSWHQGEACPFR